MGPSGVLRVPHSATPFLFTETMASSNVSTWERAPLDKRRDSQCEGREGRGEEGRGEEGRGSHTQ